MCVYSSSCRPLTLDFLGSLSGNWRQFVTQFEIHMYRFGLLKLGLLEKRFYIDLAC